MLKPLSNITILDFTVNVPGPFCTTILADLGARVIKVEPPGGDPFRHEQDMWNNLNRGKESIVLNLKSAGDRKILARLIQNIDVVLLEYNNWYFYANNVLQPVLLRQMFGIVTSNTPSRYVASM